MKKLILVFCVAVLAGCGAEENRLQSYLDNPRSFFRDPHYVKYQQSLDDLERRYLYKEISYAEYLNEKERLDNSYAQEVQSTKDIVENYR